MSNQAKLAAKLVEAALDVETVSKRGVNSQQKYTYATAEDVAEAATKALLARGVVADFECLDSESHPIKSNRGADGLIVTVTCRLLVTDSETGETEERLVMGSGSDYPGDKAIYKAMTGARKYAFIHLLQIPIGDDPETTTEPTTRRKKLEAKAAELAPERVDQIMAQIKEAKLPYKELSLAFGAVGAEAQAVNRPDSVKKAVRQLTPDQADEFQGRLSEAGE